MRLCGLGLNPDGAWRLQRGSLIGSVIRCGPRSGNAEAERRRKHRPTTRASLGYNGSPGDTPSRARGRGSRRRVRRSVRSFVGSASRARRMRSPLALLRSSRGGHEGGGTDTDAITHRPYCSDGARRPAAIRASYANRRHWMRAGRPHALPGPHRAAPRTPADRCMRALLSVRPSRGDPVDVVFVSLPRQPVQPCAPPVHGGIPMPLPTSRRRT